jgi:hypothetical protein
MSVNKKYSLILIVLIVILGVGICLNSKKHKTLSTVLADPTEIIRARVLVFGSTLKDVSLLAPSDLLKKTIVSKYGPYLTPSLLLAWQTNPTEALGRSTSSPWPDQIEILSIDKDDENTYIVSGNVIEITSNDNGKPFDQYPLKLTIIKYNNIWLIDHVVKGDIKEIPQTTK